MSEMESLSWTDIISQTQTIQEFQSKIDTIQGLRNNYSRYTPKKEILEEIKDIIEKSNIKNNLLAIGAIWCPDSALQVPRMIKIVKELDLNLLNFQVLYGVALNYRRKNKGDTWDKSTSPPEATNPKFNLTNVPTFYFFKEKEFIGRIVERPRNFPTLEEEILDILKQTL